MDTVKNILIILIVLAIQAAFTWCISVGSVKLAGYNLLSILSCYATLVQLVVFVPSFQAQTEKYYDLTGAITYISVTLFAVLFRLTSVTPKQLIAACMVIIWSARLGYFLYQRVHRVGEDSRFREMKTNFLKFLIAWVVQGLWVVLTMACLLLLMTDRKSRSKSAFSFLDIVGLAVWAVGFATEVISDRQKSQFNSDPKNMGKFINVGLWNYSRHPNYFGELVIWIGAAVFSLSALSGWQFVGLISPVFVFVLLRFVSGVPILEEKSDAKWGGQKDYEAYKQATPVFFPRIGSVPSSSSSSNYSALQQKQEKGR